MEAIFLLAEKWQDFKCPLRRYLINKLWYINTGTHNLVIKENKLLILAIPWMNFKNIM